MFTQVDLYFKKNYLDLFICMKNTVSVDYIHTNAKSF